jgi:hypothetical protein
MKYQTGYLSNQLCIEAKRVFETLSEKYEAAWKKYSLEVKDRSIKNVEFWKMIYNAKESELAF